MIRVMLIDDEEDALDLLEILLGQLGNVQVIGRYMNPVEAIEVIRTLQSNGRESPIDAVFLDNRMPGMNGMEVARAIRQMIPQMPIIFTTAHAEYAVEAFEIQSIDYLLKPFTPDRLQNAVTRVQHSMSHSSLSPRPPTHPKLDMLRIRLLPFNVWVDSRSGCRVTEAECCPGRRRRKRSCALY